MTVPVPPTTPGAPPTAPQRSEPTTFSARMDAWLAWFNASFWVWLYDLVPWMQARANETEAWANQASASASAAASSASAQLWGSGLIYALGVSVIDPTDFLTYRRKVAGAGTTRPGLDSTNWLQLGTAKVDAPNTFTAANTFSAVQTFTGGIAGVPLGKNLLINPLFTINQRVYVSGTATTTANQYTLDRWRVVTSGQSLTWTSNGNRLIVTAPAGGFEQIIEGNNIFGGSYVLNWTGTATATVNGTPRTKGEVFTLIGGVNATVRFIGGTVDIPQLERGVAATVIEDRFAGFELMLSQRHYCKTFDTGTAPVQNSGTTNGAIMIISQAALPLDAMWKLPVEMRAPPTVTTYSTNAASPNWATNTYTPTASITATGTGMITIRASGIGAAGFGFAIHATASAEL